MLKDTSLVYDLIQTFKQKKQFLLIIAGTTFLLAYLIQVYSVKLGYSNQQHFVYTPLLSLLLSLTVFIITTIIYWLINSPINSKNSTDKDINISSSSLPSELCTACEDAVLELHNKIQEILPLPDFDSEYIDDFTEEFIKVRLAPCNAYCYGLIAKCMLERNSDFFQSEENNELQHYVLNNILSITKETNYASGMTSAPDAELVREAGNDLSLVMHCVSYLPKDKNISANYSLDKLIIFLSRKISKELLNKKTELTFITQDLLIKINTRIDNLH